MLPHESRADVSVHGFWNWSTTALFCILIVNLDSGSYLRQIHAKALEIAEKEKKDKYLRSCLKRRCYFTLMVYSVNGILGTEAVAT